jgi:hypothetical protein
MVFSWGVFFYKIFFLMFAVGSFVTLFVLFRRQMISNE